MKKYMYKKYNEINVWNDEMYSAPRNSNPMHFFRMIINELFVKWCHFTSTAITIPF